MSILDTLCQAFVAADHAEHVFAYHGHLLDAELARVRYASPAEIDAIVEADARADDAASALALSHANLRMVSWARDVISTDTAIAVEHAYDFTSGRIDALPVSRIRERRFRGIVFG